MLDTMEIMVKKHTYVHTYVCAHTVPTPCPSKVHILVGKTDMNQMNP